MIQKFEFIETEIKGVFLIKTFNATDNRGNFTKDYSKEIFENNEIQHDIKEIFYTTSHKGTIRALHFQNTIQQPKLIRCIHGHIWDVVVDLRKDSPTFKKWIHFNLSGDVYEEVLIPKGCAHGYLVLEESIVSYKCAEKFYPEYDDGIIWNDVSLNITWPLEKIGGASKLIISEKDIHLQTFEEYLNKN